MERNHRAAELFALLGHRRIADDLQRRDGLAVFETDVVLLAVAEDLQLEPVRERVDDGDADAVQTAGNLVRVLVEFPAGMQLCHDDFGRRNPFLGMNVDGECRGRYRTR